MSYALFGGQDIFGRAVSVQHVANPSAQQINHYFGVTGLQLIFGGGRGRTFRVRGVLLGEDLSDLNSARAQLLSYDDGIARVLIDPTGMNWPYVVMAGDFTPDPTGPKRWYGGWALPYQCSLRGLL